MLRRVSRISPGGSAHTVVIARGDKLDGSSSGQDTFVDPGDHVVLFVNNLGGVSNLEMGAILDEILVQLGWIYFSFHL